MEEALAAESAKDRQMEADTKGAGAGAGAQATPLEAEAGEGSDGGDSRHSLRRRLVLADGVWQCIGGVDASALKGGVVNAEAGPGPWFALHLGDSSCA